MSLRTLDNVNMVKVNCGEQPHAPQMSNVPPTGTCVTTSTICTKEPQYKPVCTEVKKTYYKEVDPCCDTDQPKCTSPLPNGAGWVLNFILWFFVIAIIVYIILYAIQPSYLYYGDTETIDNSKLWLAVIVITLIIMLFIGAIWYYRRT